MEQLTAVEQRAERELRPRHGFVVKVAAAAAAALAIAGCGSGRNTVIELADGSRPPAVPHELGTAGAGAVMTKVRTSRVDRLPARARTCVASAESTVPPRTPVVKRTDVYGTSLTFRLPNPRFVFGCVARGIRREWCARVLGTVRAGRLEDSRLDITCGGRSKPAWGSGWIDPVRQACWIVVRGHGLAQVYPVAGRLPVRVTTSSVDLPRTSATFTVEQYDCSGGRVSFSILEAAVAG
jgi:hypothetical protein